LVATHGATVPRCETSQLRLSATFYGEALGSFTQTFTLTNASTRVCRLRGWPSMPSVTSRRVVQGAPTAPPFETVVLKPGAAASFDVYGADFDAVANRPCPQTSTVRIAPPGARSALSVRARMPDCGLFEVAPVIAGKSDRIAWSVVWQPCEAAELRLAVGSPVSEATEQHTLALVVTNVAGTFCQLYGYPTLALRDGHGRVLPFRYVRRGDQMITNARPRTVLLEPGAHAYLAINKNTCVTGASRAARILQLSLPDRRARLSLRLRRYPILDYCGGEPGHTIAVSPFERSRQAAFQ
jgi:hypothetical protein